MQIKCPTCKTPTLWDKSNQWRPFCSERCKLVDLGKWADGTYSIPVVEEDEENDDVFVQNPDADTEARQHSNTDKS